jgi:hypothetical protein
VRLAPDQRQNPGTPRAGLVASRTAREGGSLLEPTDIPFSGWRWAGAIITSMHPGYCPQCDERVTPFAAGCALCGADLDPKRWQRPLSVRQRLSIRLRRLGGALRSPEKRQLGHGSGRERRDFVAVDRAARR